METTITRKQTAFRLQEDLLDKLREKATACNRSLNNFVEYILLEAVKTSPTENAITPELREKIDNARRERSEGKSYRFKTAKEAQLWMENL